MSSSEFDAATAVNAGAAQLHDGWDIGGNANGGYLLALAANGLRALAGRPYADAVDISARLATALSRRLGTTIPSHAVLVDAPPAKREVEFRIQVQERIPHEAGRAWRGLETLSPVVRSLAREQFDDLVKRVRIFCEPTMAASIAGCRELESIVLECAG